MRRKPSTIAVGVVLLAVLFYSCTAGYVPTDTTVVLSSSLAEKGQDTAYITTFISEPSTSASTVEVEASQTMTATMVRPAVSYLKETIPPCVPIEGSGLEPCPRQIPPGGVQGSHTSIRLPDKLRTISEFFNAKGSTLNPHIVVRGTVLPNTIRCGMYPFILPNYESPDLQRTYEDYLEYYCFADVRINEYIVGTGPPQLTISIFQGTALGDLADWGVTEIGGTGGEELARYMNYPLVQLDPVYGGREMILFLKISFTTAVETWLVLSGSVWFLQRDGDDIRAVSDQIPWARTNEHHRQLDRPLADLIREIERAAEDRATINGGRIGPDPSMPLFVADANKLVDFYETIGAVYEGDGATLLPPPVPGGDEPARPPAPVGEDQPGASVPAPGEETAPPATDDAAPGGNAPMTTTSTIVPAMTTTAVPQVEEPAPLTTTTNAGVPQAESDTSPSTGTAAASSDGSQPSVTLPPEDSPPPDEGIGAG